MTDLIGIDREGLYKPAMRMLGRIRFTESAWHLAHMQEPLVAYAPHPGLVPPEDLMNEAIAADRQNAYKLLERAADEACGYGMNAKIHLDMAPAAAGLMDRSEQIGADLIAIGSHGKGRLASAVLGSVGRALAIGSDRSFLIGRGDIPASGDLSVVFATDHSYYAHRALEWLIERKPEGIRNITLVTAYDPQELSNHGRFIELLLEVEEEKVTLLDKIRSLSEHALSRLRAAGFEAKYSLKPGPIDEALAHAMKEQRADLLIMGAQGHGFLERVVLGSTALHQVVSERHPLMVIRP